MKVQSFASKLCLLACIFASSAGAQESSCPPDLGGKGPYDKVLIDCFAELAKRTEALEKTSKDTKNLGAGIPIGTIFSSYLLPQQFAVALGEQEGDSLNTRTWVLSDGREVTGSKFAILTGGSPVPDLRGMFLRGIPVGGPRRPGDVEIDSTALPKTAFIGLTSTDLPLTLPSAANPSRVDRYDAGGQNYPVITSGKAEEVPAHFHKVVVNGGGDSETRPVNVAVFYYIKIN